MEDIDLNIPPSIPPSIPPNPLHYVVIGAVLSFLSYKYICCLGPDCIDCPKIINNTFSNKHIHHWAIHAGILMIHIVVCYVYEIDIFQWLSCGIIGIHLGGIAHGIYTYDDWCDFAIQIPSLGEHDPQTLIYDYLKPVHDLLPKSE
jgi:hypothetical protein